MILSNNYEKAVIVILLFLFFNQINAQKLEILNDSVLVDSSYFKICELKINSKSKHVFDLYKIIQTPSKVFQTPYIGMQEERLKAKIDTLKYYLQNKELDGIGYSFEDYEIYFEKNNLVNFSIHETTYRSPWEGWRFFLMDLTSGKRIESNLFINPKNILKICKSKLKRDGFNWRITVKDLKNFQFIKSKNNTVIGLDIIFFDDTYTNHGYEWTSVHFSWKEIGKYISPLIKNRLK